MEDLIIKKYGEWSFLLEGRGDQMLVWPYFRSQPFALDGGAAQEGPKRIQFRKSFPYPANYWDRSRKVLSWCKQFAASEEFRKKELAAFQKSLDEGRDLE
ncbi:MAG: hypothetical protein JRI97_12330 [Deltaproteobacteria bacterium]|nr:hypothetical protein [Deltaproteobacteria bacterium]